VLVSIKISHYKETTPVSVEEKKMKKKLGLLIVIIILALALTACERSATTPPAGTQSASGDKTLVQPASPNATQDPMVVLQQYATQTAIAALGGSTAIAGTPGAVITPMISSTPDPNNPALPSPTPQQSTTVQIQQTPQPLPNIVVPTSTPGKPATYVLQAGEFPYCIARRFNVNPSDLLSVNNLANGQLFNPGMQLTIPQTSSGFPGTRYLIPHPANYTVRAGDTIYSIGCQFGDADPNQIILANNLTTPYTLTVGKVLYIP
jgi:LysM repeat protein